MFISKYASKTKTKTKSARINQEIRVKEVRTIDNEGEQAGVLSIEEALQLADQAGLDLVEVAPSANPPVCRVMDYGKYRYEQTKKDKIAKKKQHIIKVKEIKLRPNIDDHDYEVKLNRIKDFLEKGCKVKVSMMFKGRELAHTEIGGKVLSRLTEDIKEVGVVEMTPKFMGRTMIMTIGVAKHIKV